MLKTLNDRQSYIHSTFRLTFLHRHMIVWFSWIISICEIHGEYRTAVLYSSWITWSFHVRSFAIVRPSSFVLVTNSTSFPSMMMGSKTLCSLAKEILSSLHLLTFSWTLFETTQLLCQLLLARDFPSAPWCRPHIFIAVRSFSLD